MTRDGIDAERFETAMKSPAFAMFRDRIEGELERARVTCERADHELEVRRSQGAVAALRMALGLPDVILSELKAKVANRRA